MNTFLKYVIIDYARMEQNINEDQNAESLLRLDEEEYARMLTVFAIVQIIRLIQNRNLEAMLIQAIIDMTPLTLSQFLRKYNCLHLYDKFTKD